MDKFNPVTFDPKAHAAKKRTTSASFLEAYDALEDEFAHSEIIGEKYFG